MSGDRFEFRSCRGEGDAARFQDFFYRLVAEVSPSLIRSSSAYAAGLWWRSSERSIEFLVQSAGYFYELLVNSVRA